MVLVTTVYGRLGRVRYIVPWLHLRSHRVTRYREEDDWLWFYEKVGGLPSRNIGGAKEPVAAVLDPPALSAWAARGDVASVLRG